MAYIPPKKSHLDRHLIADRLEVRAEMKSSNELEAFPEEEVSKVIEERALSRRGSPSGFAKMASPIVVVLKALTDWRRVLGLLILLLAFVAWLKLG